MGSTYDAHSTFKARIAEKKKRCVRNKYLELCIPSDPVQGPFHAPSIRYRTLYLDHPARVKTLHPLGEAE